MNLNIRELAFTAGIVGLAMGLASSLPIILFGNCLVGMWIWGGGIAAVWLYVRRVGPGTTLTNSQGALIGTATAFVGLVVSVISVLLQGAVGVASMYAYGDENVFAEFLSFGLGFYTLGLCLFIGAVPTLGGSGGWIGVQFFGKGGE